MAFTRKEMAKEVISLFKPGSTINLGIGLPTMVAEHIPDSLNLVIHSENGVLGITGRPTRKTLSPTLINAGKETVAVGKGASFFDSALSFGMIRGGHVDYCVLGGMEVDCRGNLANWMIPGKKITGMGGAMDLVNGAKQIIVMMTHFDKHRKCKLMKKCTLPLTGVEVVNRIVSDLGVFRPSGKKFIVEKLAPGIEKDDLKIDGLIEGV